MDWWLAYVERRAAENKSDSSTSENSPLQSTAEAKYGSTAADAKAPPVPPAAGRRRARFGCLSPAATRTLREKGLDHFWKYFTVLLVLGALTAVVVTLSLNNNSGSQTSIPPYPVPLPSSPRPQSTPPESQPEPQSAPPTPGSDSGPNSSPSGKGGCASQPCDAHATCTDSGGGEYTCQCQKGWLGDGKLCARPSMVGEHSFIFANNCPYDIWVGALPPTVRGGGWFLGSGVTEHIVVPQNFNGRFWPRTHCAFDANGQGNCLTGDCGQGLKCNGGGGKEPATLAEFNLDAGGVGPAGVLDWYDVSLVDGYNVPVSILPMAGSYQRDAFVANPEYNCGNALCLSDINPVCPQQMQVTPKDAAKILPPNPNRPQSTLRGTETIACASACSAFNEPKYCCTAQYGLPTTCPPTNYSEIFKRACPGSYSYAYDDKSSLFTCRSAEAKTSSYTVKFC
mmetsp:Transcript_6970/g.12849  ORF Transcript_6970/g.12849 Transcript_6970/m.12849 type:complete len:453 (-) Transcript_6970:288-1646(-)